MRILIRPVSRHAHLAALLVVAAALAVADHATREISYDEAYSWRLTRYGLGEMAARTGCDVHPPLYYVQLKGWVAAFGDSLFSMRALSILWAIVGMLGAYHLATYALGPVRDEKSAGLWAAALMGLNPALVVLGATARMYAPSVALAVWSTYVLLRMLEGTRSLWLWSFAYALMITCLCYHHYYGFFTVASHGLAVAAWCGSKGIGWLERRRVLVAVGLAWSLFFFAYLPWVPTHLEQTRQVKEFFWINKYGVWMRLPKMVGAFYTLRAIPPVRIGAGLALLAMIIAGLAVGTMRRDLLRVRLLFVSLLGAVLLPPIFSSAFNIGMVHERGLLISLALSAPAIVALFFSVLPKPATRMVLGFLAFNHAAILGGAWLEVHPPGVSTFAKRLRENRMSGSLVLVNTAYTYFPISHALRSDDCQLRLIPGQPRPEGAICVTGGQDFWDESVESPASIWYLHDTAFTASSFTAPGSWRQVGVAEFYHDEETPLQGAKASGFHAIRYDTMREAESSPLDRAPPQPIGVKR
ncbi:glycosyltransferase family 39 protein [Singulisphaera acidiphila]|uniref:Uncharacterized protein n=1 Tax=Singulisphaera acidiphila (strain ATCC BAA-1392 / DSM 18658 / VKM B-2454 / MOB10) TaxID=886293 RepID=L0DLQ0_SINAD|nr:glycosyltransferase family 39 protein [Singulisphaera acidiphila]AGA29768.1 hypothetical protein Sinac_5636 [Singulisphaera acidiphila DSM 18658]